jgi:hypothetical protein
MALANTLAYYDTTTITAVKRFMVHALGENERRKKKPVQFLWLR